MTKALLVEDDPRILESVKDIVDSLGHDFDGASSQDEARQLIGTQEYDYVLLDLEIPVKLGRNAPRIQNGMNLLAELNDKYGKQVPVIVTTGHGTDSPHICRECMKSGAVDFVPKPFPDSGMTLDKTILEALARVGQQKTGARHKSRPSKLRVFQGGEIRLLKRRLVICEVEVPISQLMYRILSVLNAKYGNGKYVALAGSEIAEHEDVNCRRGQNGVSEAIHALRKRIATKLLEEANMEIGDQDVIRSKGMGYRINENVTISVGGRKSSITPNGQPPKSADGSVTQNLDLSEMNERQEWIMERINNGIEVRVGMVVQQFQCSSRTAKRDLAELKKMGLVRFVGSPRQGYYQKADVAQSLSESSMA